MVKTVIRWQNGMVMVFDENEKQILELQGRYEEVKDKVLAAANENTEFSHGIWNQGEKIVNRKDW